MVNNIIPPGYLRWDGTKYVLDPTVEIVGPVGPPGPATPGPQGPQGVQGTPAFSTNQTTFTQPAQGSSVGINVANNTWIAVSSYVNVVGGGVYLVTSVGPGTSGIVISNTGIPGNQTPGLTVNSGGLVTPSGAPGPTGATGPGGTPASVAVTWQPGGTRSVPNLIFTNFSEAFTTRSSIPGYATIIIDDSFGAAVIPNSSWLLGGNTAIVGRKGPSLVTHGSSPASGMTQLSFTGASATFSDPYLFQNIEIHSSTLAIKTAAFSTMNFDMIDAVFIADAASTPIISSPGGTINLSGNSYIGDTTTTHTVLGDGGSSTASTYINLFDGATIDGYTLAFTGANAPHVVIKSSAASYGSSQPASTAVPVVTGTAFSGTPSVGQVITATSANAATWQTPSGGGSSPTSNFATAGTVNSIAVGSTGGTTTTLSATATLTLGASGTAILCAVNWAGGVDANIYRVIPFLEFNVNGGSFTQFATGRASGLPTTSGAPSGGMDVTLSITRILSGLTGGSVIGVRLGATIFTTTGSANFNSGSGDQSTNNVLTLMEIV